MSKVLLVLSHPNFKDSFANKIVVDKLKTLIPDMEISHIDTLYPDGKIDVKAEQEKLLKADTIIFQFPMFCFGLNPLIYYLNGLKMYLLMALLMEVVDINLKEKN